MGQGAPCGPEGDNEGLLLVPGDWCLRATLVRDLSFKYCMLSKPDRRAQLNPPGHWRVAGSYDFLNIKRLNSLDDVPQPEAPGAHQEVRNLVLYPWDKLEPSPEFIQALETPDGNMPDAVAHPLVALTEITLSPSSYELDDRRSFVLRSLANLVWILKSSDAGVALAGEMAFLGSLSGCDLVLIARPKGPAELRTVHDLCRTARELSLAELQHGKILVDNEERVRCQAERPGHACAQVTSLLAFRPNGDFDSFKEDEKRLGIRYCYRLWVDCGHEQDVVKDLGKVAEADLTVDGSRGGVAARGVAWDTFTLHGHFKHLATFANVWDRLLFEPDWRRKHLLDSITTLTFPEEGEDTSDPGAAWPRCVEPQNRLDLIGTQIHEFAIKFLNPTQRVDLESVYNCLRSCFCRQTLLGTARDLFPFFRQLGNAFGEIERWQAFLLPERGTPEDAAQAIDRSEQFSDDLNDLIAYVHRAVRNRIEHRSTFADPPVPQTLRDGVCKIVSAYSVAVYLCWELFRRAPTDGAPGVTGDTDRFGACVIAGPHGRIVCQELFEDFRAYLENDCGSLLSRRLPDKWSAPLLLVNISGRTLMRPEYSIVHCLHECAEVSDWIQLDRCSELRKTLNRWVVAEATGYFRSRLARLQCLHEYGGDEVPESAYAQAVTDATPFCAWFVAWCLAADTESWHTLSDTDVTAFLERELIAKQHPRRLVRHIQGSLAEIGTHPDALRHFQNAVRRRKGVSPPAASLAARAASDRDIAILLGQLAALVTELHADIGMWFALHQVLSAGKPLTEAQRFDNVSKRFHDVLALVCETSKELQPRERLVQWVLHRWAIQAAAALRPGADWKAHILEYLRRGERLVPLATVEANLTDSARYHLQFELSTGLVAGLRRFQPYGGAVSIPFPHVGTEDPIATAFRRAWEAPSTATRLNLLQRVWALSGRFAVRDIFGEPEKPG